MYVHTQPTGRANESEQASEGGDGAASVGARQRGEVAVEISSHSHSHSLFPQVIHLSRCVSFRSVYPLIFTFRFYFFVAVVAPYLCLAVVFTPRTSQPQKRLFQQRRVAAVHRMQLFYRNSRVREQAKWSHSAMMSANFIWSQV